MNRASSARASSSYRGLTQEQRQNHARASANALRQIEESNSMISALRAERARTAASSSVRGKVADNIRAAHIPPKDRRKYNAAYREEEERTDTLDKINENNVVRWLQEEELQKAQLLEERRRKLDIAAREVSKKYKELPPVRTEEDFENRHGNQRSKTGHRSRLENALFYQDVRGGYAKLTKIGLLTRIMNIKKKAAKAKAKPAVRKAKPITRKPTKPTTRKPTKPTTRKPTKPIKPTTRKPTIVRRK